MVNQVTKLELYGDNQAGDIRRYKCASNAAISKGDILILSSGKTVASHTTGALGVFAGIASMEKKNNDYSVEVSAWTNLLASIVSSLAITVGDFVGTSATRNVVKSLTANTSSSAIKIGVAYSSVATATRLPVRILI